MFVPDSELFNHFRQVSADMGRADRTRYTRAGMVLYRAGVQRTPERVSLMYDVSAGLLAVILQGQQECQQSLERSVSE